MVSSTLSQPIQQRGWFDVLDDWLKRDRFVFREDFCMTTFLGLYLIFIGVNGLFRDLQRYREQTDDR
jgi:hypothetical protein